MAFDPSKPYDDLPALPPSAEMESRAVLKACIEARAAVAELKAAGQLIPNQGVLINSIPLLEAQARDPGTPYVQNNLDLLDDSLRQGAAVK